jgi:hypothetical protein
MVSTKKFKVFIKSPTLHSKFQGIHKMPDSSFFSASKPMPKNMLHMAIAGINNALTQTKALTDGSTGMNARSITAKAQSEGMISSIGSEVGIEEVRKNLIGILREFHRNCMHF